MKVLLALLLVTNVAIIWFFVLRGNVRFNINREKDAVHAEVEIHTEQSDVAQEQPDNDDLVPKSTIHIEEIRSVVADMLPGMVRNEVKELLQENDTVFDDEAGKKQRFTAVKDVDKAFQDDRIEGPADGQEPATGEDDESVPAFDDLDKGLSTLKDKSATKEDKARAVSAMLSVDGTNLVMSLPEPLHTNFLNMLTDYNAQLIDGEEDKTAEKEKPMPKPKKAKELPDSIDNFRISDYKN